MEDSLGLSTLSLPLDYIIFSSSAVVVLEEQDKIISMGNTLSWLANRSKRYLFPGD